MISPSDFCQALLDEGYDYFTGVPCSFFRGVFDYAEAHSEIRYVIAANEGAAFGLAAGATLAGRRPVVMIQNSGLGNLVNPLTSLHLIYGIPALLLVSGRAYGIPDEPQHAVMGREMKRLLETLGVPVREAPMDRDPFRVCLAETTSSMRESRIPHSLLIRKGTIGRVETLQAPSPDGGYPLSRAEAIRILSEYLNDGTIAVSTTGRPSRELFVVKDRPANLYLMGSMGHAVAVGCSLAMERPEKKVVVIDGDGAAIMHLGTLSTVGHYRPANLIDVILDNEAYESTGNQETTSKTTRFDRVALGCGFQSAFFVTEERGLREALSRAFQTAGPHLIHVKVNRRPSEDLPRITTKYSPPEIALRLIHFLNGKRA